MTPRPYQLDAIDAVDHYLATRDGNPCVVIPTAGGKTPCMAFLLQRWLTAWPGSRVLILAHVPELLAQGIEKLKQVWPAAPAGVYSAKLKGRDTLSPILFAGIQSIHNKAFEFEPWDVIFVDEAHRIPLGGEGTYRRFLHDTKVARPHRRVVGWTATAYRLGGGAICHRDHILTEVCYEADVGDLIGQGHLCRLRSKGGDATASVAGVKVRGGEFVAAQLSAAVDTADLVRDAVAEAVSLMGERKSALWFAVNKSHAERVSAELADRHGVVAPVICDGTPDRDRDRWAGQFKAGQLRGLVNVNVLTEGFDAPRVDCVVMLRPTASKGLYYQTVGRGLRLHPGKADCLVLDFAGNVERHGPIDALGTGTVSLQRCGGCKELYSKALADCPACGWHPTVECDRCSTRNRTEAVACVECGNLLRYRTCPSLACGERSEPTAVMCQHCGTPFPVDWTGGRGVGHRTRASGASILTADETPWTVQVVGADVQRHQSAGRPATLQVTYYGPGLNDRHREWVCLEHDGYAGSKARQWWRRRFGDPVPATADAAIASDLFLHERVAAVTAAIVVKRKGKYTEVVSVDVRTGAEAGAVAR